MRRRYILSVLAPIGQPSLLDVAVDNTIAAAYGRANLDLERSICETHQVSAT